MTTKVNDKVTYNPGGGNPAVTATVTAVNEDGSINIVYPHHANADTLATAEQVIEGSGVFQFSTAPIVSSEPSEVTGDAEYLRAKLDNAQQQLDGKKPLELSIDELAARCHALSNADKKRLQAALKALKDADTKSST